MIAHIGKRILNHFNVKHTEYFNKSLKSHPHYPSLLSLSDILTEYKIENVCLKIDTRKIHSVPVPFIAYVPQKKDAFFYVNEVNNDSIIYQTYKKKEYFPLQEFIKQWDGLTLILAKSDDAIEPAYKENRFQEVFIQLRKIFLIAGTALISVFSILLNHLFFQTHLIFAIALACVLAIGLMVSVLLVQQSFFISSQLAEKICKINQKSNCSVVLDSSASKLFGIISLSEIGFMYYAAGIFSLIFAPSNSTFLLLFVINSLSLPFTFFSIYYQAKVLKEWCMMCLIIQCLLWIEFFILLYHRSSFIIIPFNSIEFSKSLFWFFTPILLWTLIKPFLQKAVTVNTLQGKINRFRKHKKIFDTILEEQQKLALPAELPRLLLSDTVSAPVITLVVNPFCRPCAIAHEKIEKLLNQLTNNIRVEIIFFTESDTESRYKIAAHLLALYLQKGSIEVRPAFNQWYSMKNQNYDNWAKQFAISLNGEETHILKQHREWCVKSGISSTPYILYNGYRLPDLYEIGDMAGLL